MEIVFIHGHISDIKVWSNAFEKLALKGITVKNFSQKDSGLEVMKYIKESKISLLICSLFEDHPFYDEILETATTVDNRIATGWKIPQGFSSFGENECENFQKYMNGISSENYINGILYLASLCGMDTYYNEVKPVLKTGIYHPDSKELFEKTDVYTKWHRNNSVLPEDAPSVGILCYYGQILDKNCEEIDTVIRTLEKNGIAPYCVFCEGMPDSSIPIEKRYNWIPFFENADPKLSMLLNLRAGRILAKNEDAVILGKLNLPIIHLMRLYTQSEEGWLSDPSGLQSGSDSMVYSLSQPEISGIIEPTVVATSIEVTDHLTGLRYNRYKPINERIDHLCRRVKRWIKLRELPNSEKKLTVVLNNDPCKGVEGTLGLAVGLDTFSSLAVFLKSLGDAGYDTGDAPEDGKGILDMILERKAISEFRWTTVDEIVNKGGVLHYVNKDEYDGWFQEIPEYARGKMLDDWGDFPGESMAFKKDGEDILLVTGLQFGNIKIIVQPKRGCYGAKCNGEVCRILHDPLISPPHQWLAVYRYIRDTSDAVVHFGTQGSVEFLPGKRAALSPNCFPEITIDDLPNIYLYVMDVPGEGTVAKRRSRPVMVDHLVSVRQPAKTDEETEELDLLLQQYLKGIENCDEKRQGLVRERMIPVMKKLKFIDESFDENKFHEAAELVSRQIALYRRNLAPESLHILSNAPSTEDSATMITTILLNRSESLPDIETIASWNDNRGSDTYRTAREVILSIIKNEDKYAKSAEKSGLKSWALDIADKLAMTGREVPQFLKALNGEYIEPGLSGSLALGKTQTLPTGRNFYTSDVLSFPTEAAWVTGMELADNLLRKYLQEEGAYPESIGINLWSVDAFKSDGEVFCQTLYLMGVKPKWADNGRFSGFEVIPLEDLKISLEEEREANRPRIDVLLQTSGILRDMVPHFADAIDEAVVEVSELDEPEDMNYIRKHANQQFNELKKELDEKLSEKDIMRMATFRVFSSEPGSFETGVGLAIDASAWESSDDLTETYINSSGYAYGSDKAGSFSGVKGIDAKKLYASNLKKVDVTYMRQYSPEYDLVECGGYTGYIGAMSTASKSLSGKRAKLYWADKNPQGDLSIRDLKEDIEVSIRAKLLNKKWIESHKDYGYKGATAVAGMVNNLFKWSALTESIDKWVFDSVTETYIQNSENLEWIKENNIYALEEITRRLLEANSRGMWDADMDMLEDIQNTALMIEGDMEENIGDVNEEFQGGRVEIMTSKDVEKWKDGWKISRNEKVKN